MAVETNLPVWNSDDTSSTGGSHTEASPAAGLPVWSSDPQQQKKPILDTSWQSIVGNPQVYGSIAPPGMESIAPETASGILHGIREGVIDKPAEWLSGLFGGDRAAVAKGNQADAAAARAAAGENLPSYEVGNTAGRIGAQTAVASPFLKVAGAAVDAVPYLRAIGPYLTGEAGAGVPGLAGIAERTGAGITSGALTGAGSATLSGDNPVMGAVWGGGLGGGLSLGAQGLQRVAQTLRGTYVPPDIRTPAGGWDASDTTIARAAAAQTLQNNGVPMTVRQVTQDPALSVTSAPWSGAGGDLGNQEQSFRRAYLSKITGQGDGSTPGAPTMGNKTFVDDQTTRLSNNYNGIASRTNIDFANNLAPDLATFGQTLNTIDKETRDAVRPYAMNVANSVTKDPATGAPIITGQKYLDLTNSKSDLEALAAEGGTKGQYAQKLLDILGNAFKASASPADQALLKDTNAQWRNLQVLKAGRNPDGSFQPADLQPHVDAANKRYGGSGTGDDLVNAGSTVLQPSLDSPGGVKGALTGIAGASSPGLLASAVVNAAHAAPGLLGLATSAGLPIGASAFVAPLLAQAFNRNQANVQRAIQSLRSGAGFNPYTLPQTVVPPAVVTRQQTEN